MAFFDAAQRPEALSRPAADFGGIFAGLAARWSRWRAYHRTIAELDALDDRSLADLGFARANIPFIAHETVYGAR